MNLMDGVEQVLAWLAVMGLIGLIAGVAFVTL